MALSPPSPSADRKTISVSKQWADVLYVLQSTKPGPWPAAAFAPVKLMPEGGSPPSQKINYSRRNVQVSRRSAGACVFWKSKRRAEDAVHNQSVSVIRVVSVGQKHKPNAVVW
jgi:hypothetical protein